MTVARILLARLCLAFGWLRLAELIWAPLVAWEREKALTAEERTRRHGIMPRR
jgi:hypothetical protein